MRKAEEIEDVSPSYYRIDQEAPEDLDRAILAMGCFWGVEALFGGLEEVYRTRVGYTGGEKDHPTYRSLGNHTETVMLDFDPDKISYRELLEIFFENHNHRRKSKSQYASKIFFVDEEQRKTVEEVKPEGSETLIESKEIFWLAEDYHQKYRLRGTREAEKILEHYDEEEFINSTLAAKLNAEKAGKLQHRIDFDLQLGNN